MLVRIPEAPRRHFDAGVEEMIRYFDQNSVMERAIDEDRSTPARTVFSISQLRKEERSELEDEIGRCQDDFLYTARNYFEIVDPKGNELPFNLWASQMLVYEKWMELRQSGRQQKLQIIKARRLGCSTLIESLMAWTTMYFPNKPGLIISNESKHASFLFRMLLHIYDKLPWWMKPMIASRQEEEGLIFNNPDVYDRRSNPGLQSEVAVQAATQNSGVGGQGRRIACAHLSEYCDWDDDSAKTIIEEDLSPALGEDPEAFAFLESTAKGAGRYAHKFWRNNLKLREEAEWVPLFLPWFFEKNRVMVTVQGWRASKREAEMRDRAMRDWLKCDRPECDEYRESSIYADLIDEACPRCKVGKMATLYLTDEQLRWMEHRRVNTDHDEESRKLLRQEYACIDGSSRVSTDKGIIPIRSARGAKWTEHGRVEHWAFTGVKPVVTVKTKMGRELRCTPDHRIFGSGKWTASEDLKQGDAIDLSPPMFSEINSTVAWLHSPTCQMSIVIDEDWGRFLGYFMGDGCWSGGGVQFACDKQDTDIVEDIVRLCSKLMDHAPRVATVRGCTIVSSSDKRWFDILWNLGAIDRWGGNQHGYKRKVCVPECIWRSPRAVVKEFLSGVFEADGHAYKESPKTCFFTKHEDFVRDVQLLLLGFRVNSRISVEDKINGSGRKYIGRSLILKSAASNAFHERIGFLSRRKRTTGCVRPARQARAYANEMVDFVSSVEPSGQCDVYDLTVPSSSTFGANGLTVHNSTGEEAFQITGYQIFGEVIMEYVNSTVRDPLAVGDLDSRGNFHGVKDRKTGQCYQSWCTINHTNDDNPLTIWRFPEDNRRYTAGVDVAEGLGGQADYSVAAINMISRFPGDPDAIVAIYRSNTIDPLPFGELCNWLGRWYNEAMMSIECNKFDTTLSQLRQRWTYPNIFRWKHVDSTNMMSTKWGWFTQMNSKPRLWQTAKKWLKDRCLEIYSADCMEEMKTFQKESPEDRGASAETNMNDDIIMAVMIALYTSHDMDTGDMQDNADQPLKVNTNQDVQAGMWTALCSKCPAPAWECPDPRYTRCPKCGCKVIKATPNVRREEQFKVDFTEFGRLPEDNSPIGAFEFSLVGRD